VRARAGQPTDERSLFALARRPLSPLAAWCLYDWANSSFAVTILAAVFPIYFVKVAGGALPGHQGLVYWSFTASTALALAAVQAPLLGALADRGARRVALLRAYTAVGAALTAALAVVGPGGWELAAVLFVLAHLAWSGALVLYDALLPHLAPVEQIDRVSALGYAVGYLGSALILALNIVCIAALGGGPGARLSFALAGGWWLVFAIPLFQRVTEPALAAGQAPRPQAVRLGDAWRELVHTLSEVRRYRQAFRFLVAFWIYNDGISTIIKLAAAYGAELGISQGGLLGALLATQLVGVPATIAFGHLAARIGTKPAILVGLAVYVALTVLGAFLRTAAHFWVLATLVGLVQGGSQSLSRSLYGSMIPPGRSAEFFGFFDTSAKVAGLVGPLVFGLAAQLTGSPRLSVLCLLIFLVAGALLLLTVDEAEGRADRESSRSPSA
jgi:UMF1 family MFS transporter